MYLIQLNSKGRSFLNTGPELHFGLHKVNNVKYFMKYLATPNDFEGLYKILYHLGDSLSSLNGEGLGSGLATRGLCTSRWASFSLWPSWANTRAASDWQEKNQIYGLYASQHFTITDVSGLWRMQTFTFVYLHELTSWHIVTYCVSMYICAQLFELKPWEWKKIRNN